MTLNTLFATQDQTTTTGAKTLLGTQRLVETADTQVRQMLETIGAAPDVWSEQLIDSQKESSALDALIDSTCSVGTIDIEWLKALPEAELESMFRSQQSKKSRSRSKEMTIENYKSVVNATICTQLLRLALGKQRLAGVSGVRGEAVVFTPERLVGLARDQEQLRKEIRNIQSKKSIAKTKIGFSEDDEKWQALLVAEEQLKSVRVTGGAKFVEVDRTKETIQEMLAELTIESLKRADAIDLLQAIAVLVFHSEEEDLEADEDLEPILFESVEEFEGVE